MFDSINNVCYNLIINQKDGVYIMEQYRGHKSSRVLHLENQLSQLDYVKSLKAFDTVLNTMNSQNNFARHDGTHYYYHLVDVAQILLNFGIRDDEIIAAALLHDFIEDVEWATYEYVKEVYGKRVADIVQLVTKKPGIDYKDDEESMNEYLQNIENRYESALIKTADRMHNFGTMLNSSDKHRERQVKETKEKYIPFFKRCRRKYARYSNFFFFAKTAVEPILCEIERGLKLQQELDELKRKTVNK